MEKETKKQRGFYVEKGSFFVHAAVILLALAMAARLLGTMNLWSDAFKFATLIALPVISALLYILFILLLGRIALWTTILPVLGGAAFFILAATTGGEQLRMIICIILAFVASFVYTATLAGMIRTKWINVVVFAAILAYQTVFLAVPRCVELEKSELDRALCENRMVVELMVAAVVVVCVPAVIITLCCVPNVCECRHGLGLFAVELY